MSRFFNHIALILLVLFAGCQGEEFLEPFDYPGLLNNHIDHVSYLFDGTLIVITQEGLYVENPDKSSKLYSSSSTPNFEALSTLSFMRVGNEIIGVGQTYMAVISESTCSVFSNSNAGSSNVYNASYTVSPFNELIRVDYGQGEYDQSTGDYFYPVRLSKWVKDSWDTATTNILVHESRVYDPPTIAFSSEEWAYLGCDNLYEIEYRDFDSFDYEKIIPTNSTGIDIRYYQMFSIGNKVYSFNERLLDDNSTGSGGNYSRSFKINTTSGSLNMFDYGDACSDSYRLDYDYYMGLEGTEAFFFKKETYNFYSSDDVRGEVQRFDLENGQCSTIPVPSSGFLSDFEYEITDVAIDETQERLFIGTNQGLLLYNLEDFSVQSYLSIIIEDADND